MADKYIDIESFEQIVKEVYRVLNVDKQDRLDMTLKTNSKNIVGAINEIFTSGGSSGGSSNDDRIELENGIDLNTLIKPGRYKSSKTSNNFKNLPLRVTKYSPPIPVFDLDVIKLATDDGDQEHGYSIIQIIDFVTVKYVRSYYYQSWDEAWDWDQYWSPMTLMWGNVIGGDTIQDMDFGFQGAGIFMPTEYNETHTSFSKEDIKIYTPSVPEPGTYHYDFVKYTLAKLKTLLSMEFPSIEFKTLRSDSTNTQYCLKFSNGCMVLYGIYRDRWYAATSGTKSYISYATSFLDDNVVVSLFPYKNVLDSTETIANNVFNFTCSSSKSSLVRVNANTPTTVQNYEMETTDNSLDGLRWIAIGRWK